MFCQFRQSQIISPIRWIVTFLSLLPVAVWLHFAFVEKGFMDQFFSGQTLLVDLFLGLPVVLVFAIVIYAMIAWSLKLLIMFLVPRWVYTINEDEASEESLGLDSEFEHDSYYERESDERESDERESDERESDEPDPDSVKQKATQSSHLESKEGSGAYSNKDRAHSRQSSSGR